MALSVESLSNKLSQLADKSIGKAQTIYTKIKEKMEAIRDLNLKVVKCDESIDNIAIQKFQATALAIKESLVVMASSGHY